MGTVGRPVGLFSRFTRFDLAVWVYRTPLARLNLQPSSIGHGTRWRSWTPRASTNGPSRVLPTRIARLALGGSSRTSPSISACQRYARILEDYNYPFGFPPQLVEQFVEDLTEPGADQTDDLPLMAPSLASDADFAAWWDRASHRGASPAASRAVWRVSTGTDLRGTPLDKHAHVGPTQHEKQLCSRRARALPRREHPQRTAC